jgi:hypothetical protein
LGRVTNGNLLFIFLLLCFFVLERFCNRDLVARRLTGIVLDLVCLSSHSGKNTSHMLVTCWSRDHSNPNMYFFRKLASKVLQVRNALYNNKIYFVVFSTNINF